MKLYVLPLFLCLCLVTLVDAAPPNPGAHDPIEQMTSLLSGADIRSFLQGVSSNQWKAPYIWSKWHIDRLGNSEAQDALRRNRAFGSLLAKRLDDWSIDIVNTTTANQNEQLGSMLLDLADWVASPQGYGNLLLASRCQDISTIAIGHLVLDLKYPLESATSLVNRLDAPWQSPSVRIRALNAEAGASIFDASVLPSHEAESTLQKTWQNGQLLRIKYSNSEAKAAFEGHVPAGYEALASMTQAGRLVPVESSTAKSNLAFFTDDACAALPRPFTLANTWDAKLHEKLVIGFNLQNTQKLKAVLAFRSAVGKFPDSRKGFEEAWMPHSTRENYKTYAPAWRAYSEITSGQFVDADMREKRLATQTTATPDPNAR